MDGIIVLVGVVSVDIACYFLLQYFPLIPIPTIGPLLDLLGFISISLISYCLTRLGCMAYQKLLGPASIYVASTVGCALLALALVMVPSSIEETAVQYRWLFGAPISIFLETRAHDIREDFYLLGRIFVFLLAIQIVIGMIVGPLSWLLRLLDTKGEEPTIEVSQESN